MATVTVLSNGQTIVVNVLRNNSSGASSTTTTVAGSVVTFPYTMTTDTAFVIPPHDTYFISCLIDGIETYGQTIRSGVGGSTIAPTLTDPQLSAIATSGNATYAPLPVASTPGNVATVGPSGSTVVYAAPSTAGYDGGSY